jgi:hypothetical protein
MRITLQQAGMQAKYNTETATQHQLLTMAMLGASTTASTAVRSRLAKGVKQRSGLFVFVPMAASSSMSWWGIRWGEAAPISSHLVG